MKNIKNLLALVLALTMVLCLFACGNDENGTTEPDTSSTTQPNQTEPQQTEPTGGNDVVEPVDYVYTVTVKDSSGDPIPGVWVQICAGDSCVPKSTNDSGVAGYDTEITGNGEMAAKIISIPEGYYAADGVTEISMADGTTDVVFELEKLVYKIVVIDREDNAIQNLKVQIVDETGFAVEKHTDANGEAWFSATDYALLAEGTHTASICALPDHLDLYECKAEIVVNDENSIAFFVVYANN